jgi:hypothetical protein
MTRISREERKNRKKTPQSSQSSNTTDDSAPPAKKDASRVILAPTHEPSSPSSKLQSPRTDGGHGGGKTRRSSPWDDDDDVDDIESLLSVHPGAVRMPGGMLPEADHSPDYVMPRHEDTNESPAPGSLLIVAAEVADPVEPLEDIEARVRQIFLSEAVKANSVEVESSADVPMRGRCHILCVGLQRVSVAVIVGIVVCVGLFIILVIYFVIVEL